MSRWGGRFPMGNVCDQCHRLVRNRWHPFDGARQRLQIRSGAPLLIFGVLGGYTTFSSFECETFAATRGGAGGIAILYVMGSVLLGYIACWLGATLAALIE